jgi:hypothetical protein
MEAQKAIEIIKRMYKGDPTPEQRKALEEAYAALEKQTAISREVIEGKYSCPKCHNSMPHPGYCVCGQKLY